MNCNLATLLFSSATLAFAAPAFAQSETAPAPEMAAPAEAAPAEVAPAAAPAINEDEMADYLNSQQQIKQDVTLTRSVDGKVVESRTETVVYSKDDPLRETEAGQTPLQQLQAEFDSQALTRKEAIEEARLDFIVADLDRNDSLSIDEFLFLIKGWEDAEISGIGRSRFVDPFVHADAESAAAEHEALARTRFTAIADGDNAISRREFARAVTTGFKTFDLNDDDLLQGDELIHFRAAARGETAPEAIETTTAQ